MKVSIIVPALNEAAGLQFLLAQLQAARRCQHEVIVVDGGSSDQTVAVATPLVDELVVTSMAGRALQMNAGAQAASGQYLWFLHADSLVPPAAVEKLQALPPGCWGRFNVRLSGDGWKFRMIAFCMNLRSRLTGIATGDQGIFVCAELFHRIEGYPQQPLMEDIEISRRLRNERAPICLPDELQTSSRRWERHGVMRTILLMWRLRLMYFFGASPVRLAAIYRSE